MLNDERSGLVIAASRAVCGGAIVVRADHLAAGDCEIFSAMLFAQLLLVLDEPLELPGHFVFGLSHYAMYEGERTESSVGFVSVALFEVFFRDTAHP